MAAAMNHKFGILCKLRKRLIPPAVRKFHRFTNPKSLSVTFTHRTQRKSSNITLNQHEVLFTSRHFTVSRALSVRFNSTSGSRGDGSVIYVPPPSNLLSDESDTLTSETVNAVNALGEPTLSSLGLGSWSPVGMIQQLTEFLHISLDIPWWGSICIVTICIRTLMLPIFIKSQRNSANFHNMRPELQKYQEHLKEAKTTKNTMAIMFAKKNLSEFMGESKFSPFMFLYPFFQLPVFLSVFWGLQGMANAPVESMKEGGMLWFTDLTLADPTWYLPVCCSGLLLATVELNNPPGFISTRMKWFMRGMPIVFIPIISHLPTAILCYWITSNTISLVLASAVNVPGVKSYFNIPERRQHPDDFNSAAKKPLITGIKDKWNNAKLQDEIKQKQKINSKIYKEAGSAPIPKTYSVDPTGGKGKSSKTTWSWPWSKSKSKKSS